MILTEIKCPNCGGNVEFHASSPYVCCGYCGNKFIRTDSLGEKQLEIEASYERCLETLSQAKLSNNVEVQYKCYLWLGKHTDDAEARVMLDFFDILFGNNELTGAFLKRLSPDNVKSMLRILDSLPKDDTLNGRPLASLALGYYLRAIDANEYAIDDKSSSLSYSTPHVKSTKKSSRLFLFGLFSALSILGISLCLSWNDGSESWLIAGLVGFIELIILTFVVAGLAFRVDAHPLLELRCYSPGLSPDSHVKIFQDAFVVSYTSAKFYKSHFNVFPYRSIAGISLRPDNCVLIMFKNSSTTLFLKLFSENDDGTDVYKLVSYISARLNNA